MKYKLKFINCYNEISFIFDDAEELFIFAESAMAANPAIEVYVTVIQTEVQ